MDSFERVLKIEYVKTTNFPPRSNGTLERTHGTVKDLFQSCTLEKSNDWDGNLNLICMGYNTAVHEATGFNLFELTFVHKTNIPSTI